MDEEFSFIDIRGEEEVILQAVVFVEDRLGNFSRYYFERNPKNFCVNETPINQLPRWPARQA